MMLIIMARVDTTERVVVKIQSGKEIQPLQVKLREQLGGNWVWVQELGQSQVIHFDCGEEYGGFDNRKDDNYCGNAVFELINK
jgi:hypothetical protein